MDNDDDWNDEVQERAMAPKTPAEAQWNAVFLRVLKTGDVDRAFATADKAVPAHVEARRLERESREGRAAAGRRRQRSKPWIGRMYAAAKKRAKR